MTLDSASGYQGQQLIKPARQDITSFDAGLDPFDLVGRRKMQSSFVSALHAKMGKTDWLLSDTQFSAASAIPETITVRDHLTVIANMACHSPNPGYHIDYVLAGVPLYRGPLDLGLQSAPNLRSALELLARYGDDRPGYHRHLLTEHGGMTRLELVQMTRLSDARRMIVETPLLLCARLAARFIALPVDEAIVEFRHSAPPYVDKLRAAFNCELRFDATRDAISIPTSIATSPSVAHDPDMWRTSLFRCQDEVARTKANSALKQAEAAVAKLMSETGRVPRLAEAAQAIGVSSRTLIRRLRKDDLTFAEVVDSLLQFRSIELLADARLTIARVSEELGFTDTSGFHRRFRRWFGMTPDQYRKKHPEIQ